MTKPCAWSKKAIERKRDCEGAYYLLFRGLFAAGRCQEVVDLSESAIEASGEDYNVYVPILNSLGSLEKEELGLNMTRRFSTASENHLKHVPEDARARVLLGANYARLNRGARGFARTPHGGHPARRRILDSLQRRLHLLPPK